MSSDLAHERVNFVASLNKSHKRCRRRYFEPPQSCQACRPLGHGAGCLLVPRCIPNTQYPDNPDLLLTRRIFPIVSTLPLLFITNVEIWTEKLVEDLQQIISNHSLLFDFLVPISLSS